MISKECIINAKRGLLCLLLEQDKNSLTDNEIEIMYLLSKDKDIQTILENSK